MERQEIDNADGKPFEVKTDSVDLSGMTKEEIMKLTREAFLGGEGKKETK